MLPPYRGWFLHVIWLSGEKSSEFYNTIWHMVPVCVLCAVEFCSAFQS